ncbi:hypothetical protein KP509_31G015500 [Ceratopteris richardii]|uniref:Protein kinase domain-containing protein n=1 Tax=Ceratopteris richardii TaxID=49495 RepID=A0A8T2QVP6_CERRI|nr:hypothetical protein KP509_31G015500 [Ceratopteris richardii]
MIQRPLRVLHREFLQFPRMVGDAGTSTKSASRRSHGVDGVHRGPHPFGVPRFKLDDIYSATCRFDKRFLVTNAALSQIYVAKLSNGIPVFVKRSWPGDRFWDAQLALENERTILSSCRGTYLLNLVGVSDDTPERVLLLENASYGNLFDALHGSLRDPIDWPMRFRIAHHVAVALRGLHGARSLIVHRDVKSSNVWINENWSAKLGGFEFALKFSRPAKPASPNCPQKAMSTIDPDYQGSEFLCAKTDVFCFGVLLFEIITGRKAFDVTQHPPFVVDWALPLIHQKKTNLLCDPKMRPPFQNSRIILDMARIAERCVTAASSRRPTMAEIAEELKVLSLRVPVLQQKNRKRQLHWSNMPSLKAMEKALGTYTERPYPCPKDRVSPKHEATFRCERPSMIFGVMSPRDPPQKYFLNVLEDALARHQREPHLPPHLRHDFE